MAKARVVPSDLFPLIFGFLRENHFDGAARAFGKATGVTEPDPNAASLLDVFNYWLKSPEAKKRQAFPNGPPAKKAKKEVSSSSESSSEDEEPPAKKASKPVPVPKVPVKAVPNNSESSSDDSSDSSDSEEEKKKPVKKGADVQVKKTAVLKTKPQKKPSSSSSDSSSSEDEAPKKQLPKSTGVKKAAQPPSKSEMGAKVTKVKPKISNGKAEGSSSSDSSSDSSSGSHTEKKAPVKNKPVNTPQSKSEVARVPVAKGKTLKKGSSSSSSSSEESSDSSEDEKQLSKPKTGQYSAVPPPASMESKNNKAQALASKNKLEKSDKKKQVSNKRITAEGPVAKQQNTPKSVPLPTRKEEDSSESDSDSSSEEDKKVVVKVSVKPAAAKVTAKPSQSKRESSSSDSSDSDSSENEVPVKSAGKPDTKTAKKSPVAEKANGSTDGKKVLKKGLGAKTTKPGSKSNMPASKASSSDSSSSSSDEEEKKPALKPSNKLAGENNVRAGKEAPLESSSSSDSSSDEEPKKAGTGMKKKVKDSSSISEKKKSKTSSSLEGKKSGLKNLTSEGASVSQFSSSGEEAVDAAGLPKKKRKREEDQESETPDNKKMKPRTPHTFPKMKRQSSPFRRVKAEEIEVDARVANNSFDAKKGASGDWGEKANEVLKFTKGKSFRHEKTKKKRGSYCGGSISTEINSIKFESD